MSDGIGVMINRLFGDGADSTRAAMDLLVGSTIESVQMDNKTDPNTLVFRTDRGVVRVWDDGQSCCESRYMVTDDDFADFIGAVVRDAEVRDGGRTESDGGDHEIQFLVVTTTKGALTVATHVEHNGYYGGFSLTAMVVP